MRAPPAEAAKTGEEEEEEEVVERSREDATASPTALAAATLREAEARVSKPSHVLPPLDEKAVMEELGEIGLRLGDVPRDGNCWPASCLVVAGEDPSLARIRGLRAEAVDLVTGARPPSQHTAPQSVR